MDQNDNALIAFNVAVAAVANRMDPTIWQVLPGAISAGPFRGFVGKYSAGGGGIIFLTAFGNPVNNNQITGLEYCPFDDTIIISGNG